MGRVLVGTIFCRGPHAACACGVQIPTSSDSEGRHGHPEGKTEAARSSRPLETANLQTPVCEAPVSYTHLRAHETSAHL
eukprot:2820434-Alexandrium_andersonii.AAC.1